ncbi:MAG: glycosyltransferase [Deltaproteobacteria bacterium]|nr:MAG: glycosyltransferase [Deltaproteobacteria bacterium]
MDDLISVVITTYNGSKYIESAIQSVLNQTYKSVEIIVVDDCSTDDTTRILFEYKDKIKVIRHEINRGAAEGRNTGIDQCRGRFIAFLDEDDKWIPEKLEVVTEAFSGSEDAMFAFSDFSRFEWGDGAFYALSNSQIFPVIYETLRGHTYFDRRYFTIPRKDMFTLLLGGYPIYPSTMVVRKRIFDSVGMWRKIATNEDFDFSLRSCRATDFIYIDEKLTMIGRHGTNLSNDILRQTDGNISVVDLHLADTNYSKEEIDMLKYYRGGRLCGLGYSYRRSGDNKQALRKYCEALSNRKWFWHALVRIGYLVAISGFQRKGRPGTSVK